MSTLYHLSFSIKSTHLVSQENDANWPCCNGLLVAMVSHSRTWKLPNGGPLSRKINYVACVFEKVILPIFVDGKCVLLKVVVENKLKFCMRIKRLEAIFLVLSAIHVKVTLVKWLIRVLI